jgi:hypothetical protein
MKQFYFENGNITIPLNCFGDEHNKCDSCIARFSCFTGNLGTNFGGCKLGKGKEKCRVKSKDECMFVMQELECRLFGIINGFIEYDESKEYFIDGENKGFRIKTNVGIREEHVM